MSFLIWSTFVWDGYQLHLFLSKNNTSKCCIMWWASVKSFQICFPCNCKNVVNLNPFYSIHWLLFLNRKDNKKYSAMKEIFKTKIIICQYLTENITLYFIFFLWGNGIMLLVLMHFFNDVFSSMYTF
jgi:hypothetical protein